MNNSTQRESAERPQPEHIMQFFTYEHLPEHLKTVSKPFCDLANFVVENLPRNQQRTISLNRIMEAKDAAVRAQLAK